VGTRVTGPTALPNVDYYRVGTPGPATTASSTRPASRDRYRSGLLEADIMPGHGGEREVAPDRVSASDGVPTPCIDMQAAG
jgi:hypothetical protein